MDASASEGYQPPPGFVEDMRGPLIDLNLTDSKELWLIQWSINQPPPYFNGQQISLNLNSDGHMGSFEDDSGKSYDLVCSKSQGPQPIVVLPSAAGAKIAGKVSKRVSLVHYPEPNELMQRSTFHSSQYLLSSAATSTLSGHRYATPTRTITRKSSEATSGYSTPSSRNKSSLSESRELLPKSPKGKSPVVGSGSSNISGKRIRNVTSSSSLEHSEEKKPKKKKLKVEGSNNASYPLSKQGAIRSSVIHAMQEQEHQ